jgi:hypothetical protein
VCQNRLKQGVKKRRREDTPPELLQSDRENRFQDDEERAPKRTACGDSLYKASSVSEDSNYGAVIDRSMNQCNSFINERRVILVILLF